MQTQYFYQNMFRLYEELKVQYEHEKSKLKQNIEEQVIIVNDLRTTLSVQLKEKEEMKYKIVQLEKQIQ